MIKTKEELQEVHHNLHRSLDCLVACYIMNVKDYKRLSELTVMELMEWSHEQCKNPSCYLNQIVTRDFTLILKPELI